MLKINLLPLEKRKPERTPIPRFALILALTAVTAASIFFVIYLILQVSEYTKILDGRQTAYQDVLTQVADYGRLQADAQKKKAEWAVLAQVPIRPMPWSRALKTLWDVLAKHPKIWIDTITIMDPGTARGSLATLIPGNADPTYGGVILRCGAAGDDIAVMAKFRADLKTDPDLRQFFDRINVASDWTIIAEEGYPEKFSIPFQVTLFSPPQAKPVIQAK